MSQPVSEQWTHSYLNPYGSQDDELIDVNADVIPIYQHPSPHTPPSKTKLVYDIVMLIALVGDLGLIFADYVLMSGFVSQIGGAWVATYQNNWHKTVVFLGGLFTLFLVLELLVRWAIAVHKNTYYRWFFFPFVHWYEVLGCLPVLRPLRLLRAIIIIKRLHDLGVSVLPARLIKTAKFYGHILLEELSDRVILTALDNLKNQLSSNQSQASLERVLDKNRAKLQQALTVFCQTNLLPSLCALHEQQSQMLAQQVGEAVEEALIKSPELRRTLRLIPIAGSLIEGQLTQIGKQVGEQVTLAVSQKMFSQQTLTPLMADIAHQIAHIDITSRDYEQLVHSVVKDALEAFEAQIKIQQWKHTKQLKL